METITLSTKEHNEFVDITKEVSDIVKKSKIGEGLCHIFVPHATAGITINENADPNLPDDIISSLKKIIKEHDGWKHDDIDNNAAAHIKSSIIGCHELVPVKDGELVLGTWQDIFFCEFDGPRSNRHVVVTIVGK
ncbi:secondary thiamine-phosphate synthase enzyme YjbQ [Nanoarchaeota archaeon]